MVNVYKIEGLIHGLEAATKQLRDIAQLKREALLGNGPVLGGAKYYLQTAIETCINMGAHIIASEGYRAPKDYRDVFTVLNENGILPDDFTATMRQIAGLRNRLVHLYWEVDDERICDYLQDNLGDFDTFVGYVLEFFKRQGTT